MVLLALTVSSAAPAANETALVLSESFHARGLALGEAQTGLGDVTAVRTNPAAAAGLKTPYLSAYMRPASFGVLTGNLQYARPAGRGALEGSLSYLRFGEIELLSPAGLRRFDAGSDYAVAVSYGAVLGGPVRGGVGAKYLSSRLAETFEAEGWAADAGVFAELPVPGVSLGAALRNVGSGLRYVSVVEKSPAEVRIGGSWRGAVSGNAVLAVTDAVYSLVSGELGGGGGVEAVWLGMVRGRLGYRRGIRGRQGAVMGLGLTVQGVDLDYAAEFETQRVGGRQAVSLSYRFEPG